MIHDLWISSEKVSYVHTYVVHTIALVRTSREYVQYVQY